MVQPTTTSIAHHPGRRNPDGPDHQPGEDEQSTVLQLVYASAATVPFSDDDLIELLQKAKARNDALGITGMLLYHEGSFIQAIEGDPNTVLRLYAKIQRDWRHDNCLLLYRGTSFARSFGSWSMGFERLDRHRHKHVPGLSRFLDGGALALSSDDGDQVHRAMVGFRAGKYRRG